MSLRFVAVVAASIGGARADSLIEWDFGEGVASGWIGNARVESMKPGGRGLVITCVGEDPWIEGPRFDAPEDGVLRVTLTMKTDGGPAHLFYGKSFSEERVQMFPTFGDGEWHDYAVMIAKSTGRGTRLRFDPFSDSGVITLRRIRVEAIAPPADPPLVSPGSWGADESEWQHRIRSGEFELDHHGSIWNGIRLRVGSEEIARGYDGELIGVMADDGGDVEFLELATSTPRLSRPAENQLEIVVSIRDSRGADWTVTRNYKAVATGGAIEVTTAIVVSRDSKVVLLPWMTLLPGHGSFGARKHQGLFAGVEYLANEPSSSEADLRGPRHFRRIPDPLSITLPLMAIENDGRYVGLIWDKGDAASGLLAAGFDSPDRVFGSGGHAMWLSGPGIGEGRFANDLVAHSPVLLKADEAIKVRAVVIGGRSASVVGAVQKYLSLRPPPPLPNIAGGYQAAVELLAHGWLDSEINEGWRFKHAVWQGKFGSQPAAGPALSLSWLAHQTTDAALAERLRDGVRRTLANVSPGDPYTSHVSHVRLPATALVFGKVAEYVARRKHAALNQLGRFDAEGKIVYRPGKSDYSKTHFADHANGLGANVLAEVLEAATLSADQNLTERALAVLDKQVALYANSVPRGAQTWEMPLHTPDILASAHLVRAYVYGYALTGREDYLEQAKYWAWTGVPLIYLVNPTGGETGAYATSAVLGATNWVAPVWIGLPVQWCGLVYGSALHRLRKYDPFGPWAQLANGITRAGLQMTWPTSDKGRQGLLPDFFHLERQVSDGPAINPGTVGAHLPEAFGAGKIYDFHRFSNGWIAHAPCEITNVSESDTELRFDLEGWGEGSYHLLLAGVGQATAVMNGDEELEVAYEAAQRLVIVALQGGAQIRIRKPIASSDK